MLEGPRARARVCRDNVPVSDQLILINEQSLYAHRSAGVRLVRADADLRSETITETVGKARGGVPVDACGIYFIQESLRVGFVFRDYCIRMSRSVFVNVIDSLIEAVDGLHIHDEIEI